MGKFFERNIFLCGNMFANFLNPLILRARSARRIKGFRKLAKVLVFKDLGLTEGVAVGLGEEGGLGAIAQF